MNIQIAISAVVMAAAALAHVFIGGAEIMAPVNASDLPVIVRAIVGVVWHGVTLLLTAMTVISAWLIWHRNNGLMALLAVMQIGFIVLFVGYGLYHTGNVIEMPQWTFFVVTLALLLWGSAQRTRLNPEGVGQ